MLVHGYTIAVSQRLGDMDLGGWHHYRIIVLGIGPGDIVAGDVAVGFDRVEQALFLRPDD
jgi:hypothetical protein